MVHNVIEALRPRLAAGLFVAVDLPIRLARTASRQNASSSALSLSATRDARRPFWSSAILTLVERRTMPRLSKVENSAGTRRTSSTCHAGGSGNQAWLRTPVGRSVGRFVGRPRSPNGPHADGHGQSVPTALPLMLGIIGNFI